MEKTRDELRQELDSIHSKESEIIEQLKKLDYDARLNNAQKNVGKCYIEIHEATLSDSVRCVYVYAVDLERCQPHAISISYWKNNEAYFSIEYFYHFDANPESDSCFKWKEISREEYDLHYLEATKRINGVFINREGMPT